MAIEKYAFVVAGIVPEIHKSFRTFVLVQSLIDRDESVEELSVSSLGFVKPLGFSSTPSPNRSCARRSFWFQAVSRLVLEHASAYVDTPRIVSLLKLHQPAL